ncbi:MAG: cadherin-like beta sandwich domain-containing protein [Rhodospirillales bacterium]|nr:cadherin-like beta sandwich domain-containing protein [Rhodospirillales bacterium]
MESRLRSVGARVVRLHRAATAALFAAAVALPVPATAQTPNWLTVHPGVLVEAPSELPLKSTRIRLRSRPDEAHAYAVEVPADTTGITMVVDVGLMGEFGGFDATDASGDKLEMTGWTFTKRKSVGRTTFPDGKVVVASFDSLEEGVNNIRVRRNQHFVDVHSISVTRAAEPSSTAALVSLSLLPSRTEGKRSSRREDAYALTPAFHADTTHYEVEIPPDRDRLIVRAKTEPWWGRVEVRGTAADGTPLPIESNEATGLAPGTSTLALAVVAEDGSTTSTYTVAVTRDAPTGDATLHGLALWQSTPPRSLMASAGAGSLESGDMELEPAFDPRVGSYALRTPASSLTLRAKAAEGSTVTAAVVADDGARRGGSSFSLNTSHGHFYGVTLGGLAPGSNGMEVTVKADGGNRRTYRLVVERAGSVAAALGDLQVWRGKGPKQALFVSAMSGGLRTGDVVTMPNFDAAVADYAAALSGGEVTLRCRAPAGASIQVAGRNPAGEDLSADATVVDLGTGNFNRTTLRGLAQGANVVTVTVSLGGDRKVYEITVNVDE